MKITLYDQVCWGYSKLGTVVREALKNLNIQAEYQMVADLNVMKAIGLEYTPALEIDGVLISQGQFYTLEEMKALLSSRL